MVTGYDYSLFPYFRNSLLCAKPLLRVILCVPSSFSMNLLRLSLLSGALLVAACSPVGSDGGESDSSSSEMAMTSSSVSGLPEGDFRMEEGADAPVGTVYVRGYAYTQMVDEPFCTEDCDQFTYVFFRMTERSENPAFGQYISQNDGNSFFGSDSVGLGCEVDGRIEYANQTEVDGMVQYVLSDELSEAILDSDEDGQITLKLTKLPLGGGRGAPACYAHFTEVELVE